MELGASYESHNTTCTSKRSGTTGGAGTLPWGDPPPVAWIEIGVPKSSECDAPVNSVRDVRLQYFGRLQYSRFVASDDRKSFYSVARRRLIQASVASKVAFTSRTLAHHSRPRRRSRREDPAACEDWRLSREFSRRSGSFLPLTWARPLPFCNIDSIALSDW